jgi:hypothetical protein
MTSTSTPSSITTTSASRSRIAEKVEIRATHWTIAISAGGAQIAAHVRSFVRGKKTTVTAHMPKAHQKHAEWTPARLSNWASKIGPSTECLMREILEDRPHPEQGYRSCLGILRLAPQYGDARLDAASTRAVAAHARSYRCVAGILKNGLDRIPMRSENEACRGPTALRWAKPRWCELLPRSEVHPIDLDRLPKAFAEPVDSRANVLVEPRRSPEPSPFEPIEPVSDTIIGESHRRGQTAPSPKRPAGDENARGIGDAMPGERPIRPRHPPAFPIQPFLPFAFPLRALFGPFRLTRAGQDLTM